jgi:hypothetical protein
MPRYLLRFTLFIIPLVVLISLPAVLLWRVGEFTRLDDISRSMGRGENMLVGNAYWPQSGTDLVLGNIDIRRPQVIALGNSRVLQFRQEFFKTSFANAGGTIQKISELNAFLEKLPEGYDPKFIILGLEQSYFHPEWTKEAMSEPASAAPKQGKVETYMTIVPQVYRDYLSGKFRLDHIWNGKPGYLGFGLNAWTNGNGLRSDGSYRYGKFLADPQDSALEDFGFKDTKYRMNARCCRFETADRISDDAVNELGRFLEAASTRGIRVVAFLPPYPHEIFQDMMSAGDDYAYIKRLEPALQPLFSKYGFRLYDFSDLDSTGAASGEYIDGLHASEKAYLRIWIKMAQDNKVLGAYTDIPAQEAALTQAKNNYEVYSAF